MANICHTRRRGKRDIFRAQLKLFNLLFERERKHRFGRYTPEGHWRLVDHLEKVFLFLSFSSILYFVRKVHGKYLLGRRGRRVGIRKSEGFSQTSPFFLFCSLSFFLLAWLNLLFPLPVSLFSFFLPSRPCTYGGGRGRGGGGSGLSETNRGRWSKMGFLKGEGGDAPRWKRGGIKLKYIFCQLGAFLEDNVRLYERHVDCF